LNKFNDAVTKIAEGTKFKFNTLDTNRPAPRIFIGSDEELTLRPFIVCFILKTVL
jgi:hypothetical protein